MMVMNRILNITWCEEGHPATKYLLQQLVTKQDFLENGSVAMTKREILIVAKDWLSTLCCWEVVVHTLD